MRTVTIIAALLLLLAGAVRAEIPQTIGYQGRITDNGGNPVADGDWPMRFRIYDAQSGGSLLWDSGTHAAATAGGVFNVMLGESPHPALNLEFNQDYWLLVTFDYEDQSPRRRLGSVGYAYMASGLVPGTEVSGSVAGVAALKAVNSAVGGYAAGLHGEVASTQGDGVLGQATATSGGAFGGRFLTASPSGTAVRGYASAATGMALGGNFESACDGGIGVGGYATSAAGTNYGVYGATASASGRGVYGEATANSGSCYGVEGRSESTMGVGVYGAASAPSGYTCGVYGIASAGASPNGTGVFGQGNSRGVYGSSPSSSGMGVYGEATHTTGSNYGGYFQSSSTNGRGVYALTTATGGDARAVYGQSWSSTGQGVCGYASATAGANRGVYGRSSSGEGCGVYGYASATWGTTYGVYGLNHSNSGAGLRGECTASGGIGVSGKGGPGGYAGDFEGNVRIRSRSTGMTIMELGEGLDYAEGFKVSEPGSICPGTVLVVDPDTPGTLTVSDTPYDSRVAGIVAGANGLGSGVRLGAAGFDCDVALAGRVYCNVDATQDGVKPGDLLTTSGTPGYAMKASDAGRAHGATLGKAMERMPRGEKGRILVLVSLQ